MNDPFLRCRSIGHAWYDCDADRPGSWGTPFAVRCERCSTYRQFNLDSNGDVVGRRYQYPEGYSYTHGETPAKADFRLALLAERLEAMRDTRLRAIG
jgi:hypothetical protein